jgi:hypothetical protein
LARQNSIFSPQSIYAVVSNPSKVCYLAEDRAWWVKDGAESRLLAVPLPEQSDRRLSCRYDVAEMLVDVLKELGLLTSEESDRWLRSDALVLNDVYFTGESFNPWHAQYEDENWRFSALLYFGDGSGSGLIVEDKHAGSKLTFGIPFGVGRLVCRDAALTDDDRRLVFRCGRSILVMDMAERKVGKLVDGDSFLMLVPEFTRVMRNVGH